MRTLLLRAPASGVRPSNPNPPSPAVCRSAAARGHLSIVKLLLDYGANLHHVNSKHDGGSAVHEAVAHKHEAVVEVLLAAGGNPFVENVKVGGTRLRAWVWSVQSQQVRRLLIRAFCLLSSPPLPSSCS